MENEPCAFYIKGDKLFLNDGTSLKIGEDISRKHACWFIDNLRDNFETYGDTSVVVHLADTEKPMKIFSYPVKPNAFGTSVIQRGSNMKGITGLFHRCSKHAGYFTEHTLNNPIRFQVCLRCGSVSIHKYYQR